MLSLESVSGKWKNKGKKKQLFAQAAGHACRQLLEAGNNLYTYTCDELYMASPLEKKQRTGSVNIRGNADCPGLFYGSYNEQVSGNVSRGG